MAEIRLKSLEFRKERERVWDELERLISRGEGSGLASLSSRDLARLPVLYRATVSSLSVARAISLDRNLIEYLESLAGRAYILVYGTRRGLMQTLVDFVTRVFPQTVRRFKWHIAIAGAFMVLGILAGFFLVLDDPERFYSFIPAEYAQGRDPAATTEALRETLYDTDAKSGDLLAVFAAGLFSHNSQIGILSFVLGFAVGVPVFLLQFVNGLILGAFAALFHSRGLSVDLWGWLLPHGVTEITALVLCGGGGLVIAGSLVFPGQRTRLQSLAAEGREAAQLVFGALFMLLLAGLIEGIFRQTVHHVAIRYFVATATAVFWIAYFGFAGRERR